MQLSPAILEAVRVERLSRDWDELAEQDALFVVLAEPGKEGGRWSLEEFFATGEREITHLLHLRPQCLARSLAVRELDIRSRLLEQGPPAPS